MSPQMTPMFHEIKNLLYQTNYLSAPRTTDDVNIEGIWSKTLNDEEYVLHNLKHPTFGT